MNIQTVREHDDTLVILIHGFCRGAKDMQFWKKCLQPEFPHILTPDLPTTFASFQTCTERLEEEVATAAPEQYRNILIAGHSMGGLLARAFLQRNPMKNVSRLVCAGTPHSGSKLADIALKIPGTGAIWKPLHALKCSARTQLITPEIPDLEIGAIVSCSNTHWTGKYFLSDPADGLVELHSATPQDAKSVVQVSANHVKMQYDPYTAALIKKFFLCGNF